MNWTPQPFEITSRAQETADSFSLELSPTNGEAFEFTPGQFNMLYGFGYGEAAISISGAPGGPLVHTIRAVGGVTNIFARLAPGAQLGLRGPFGTGWPVSQAQDKEVVLVAGGIGLAPLRPVVYHHLRNPFKRLVLLIGARSHRDLLFEQEILSWVQTGQVEVMASVDTPGPAWWGQVGVVTELIPRANLGPDAIAMLCGPEVMMRYAADGLLQAGLSPERVFVSAERNMKCGMGLCGHCQWGGLFVCKDGPVFPLDQVKHLFKIKGI